MHECTKWINAIKMRTSIRNRSITPVYAIRISQRERFDVLLAKALDLCSSAVGRAAQFDDEHKLQHRLTTAIGDAYLQAASGLTRARSMATGVTQQYVHQPLHNATAAVVVGLGHAASTAEQHATSLSDLQMVKSAGSSLQSVGEQLDRVSAQVAGLKVFEQAGHALAAAREQVAVVRTRWAGLPPAEVPQQAAADALAAARGALAAVQATAFAHTAGVRAGTQKAIADAQGTLAAVLAEAGTRVEGLRIATESAAERMLRAGTGAAQVVSTGCLGAAGRADARLGVASAVLRADEQLGAWTAAPLGLMRKAVQMLPQATPKLRDLSEEDEDVGAEAEPTKTSGDAVEFRKDAPALAPRTLSSHALEAAELAREGCVRAAVAVDRASYGTCVSMPLRAAGAVDRGVFCGLGGGLLSRSFAAAGVLSSLARWSAGVFFEERERAAHEIEMKMKMKMKTPILADADPKAGQTSGYAPVPVATDGTDRLADGGEDDEVIDEDEDEGTSSAPGLPTAPLAGISGSGLWDRTGASQGGAGADPVPEGTRMAPVEDPALGGRRASCGSGSGSDMDQDLDATPGQQLVMGVGAGDAAGAITAPVTMSQLEGEGSGTGTGPSREKKGGSGRRRGRGGKGGIRSPVGEFKVDEA